MEGQSDDFLGRDWDEDATRYREMLKTNPHQSTIRILLSSALRASGKIEEGLNEFRTAVEQMPDDANAHVVFGKLLAEAGRFEEALRMFQKATVIDPESYAAYLYLGYLLLRNGLRKEARAAWTEVLLIWRRRHASPGFEETRHNTDLACEAESMLDTYPAEE